jgi:pimeloyl-ACP methyl ester carboxylesterase
MEIEQPDNQMSQSITLNDGRRMGFAEYGDPYGHPILLFVGGSSRVVRPPEILPNIRLLTIDRPGLGLSDFQPGRKLLDFPDDVQ